MRRIAALTLLAALAPAAEPGWRDLLDPESPAFPTGQKRTNLRHAAFERAAARGLAPAVKHFRRFEKHLAALDKRIEKDHETYLEAHAAYWGWRRRHEEQYKKKHGRMPARYDVPESINRTYIDQEEIFKRSRSLKLRERLFHEWIHDRIAKILREGSATDHDKLVAALVKGLKDRNEHQRLRCARLLAGLEDEAARKGVAAAVRRERHPGVLAALLEGGTGAGDVPDYAPWPVRAGAIRGLRPSGEPAALVARLEKEEGRLRDDATHALRELTGQDLGSDAAAWRAWWEGAKAGWEPPPPAKPKEPDLTRSRGVFSDGRTTCFGIRTSSRAIVYCIEASTENVWSYLREEVERSIASLPDGASLGVVLYGKEPRRWKRTMTRLDASARASLKKFFEELEPDGGADLHAALQTALDLAAPKRGKEPAADTLFLAAVSGARSGVFDNPRQVMLEITARNALLGVRIHAFGPSAGRDSFYLQTLCRQFGGTHAGGR